jgi:4-hydroxythreonine-4-phosphate dehydrogenase
MKNPVIGITIGDPAGIGPEIIEKALRHFQGKISLRIIGSAKGFPCGKLTIKSAKCALEALEESIVLLKNGEIQAVVNAPVHKGNLAKIGFRFPGQTEFYAARCGLKSSDVTMMLTSEPLTVALVTTHCSLKQALSKLSVESIVRNGTRVVDALVRMNPRHKPKLAVCGLNPHAGEDGLFGDEEKRFIVPAIHKLAKDRRAIISGPHVPDAVFRNAVNGQFDAVLCLYHDQGLIPLKLVGFDTGVNVTLGLPFWRATPDHGTAIDIAGKGKASPQSMIRAIETAYCLTKSA